MIKRFFTILMLISVFNSFSTARNTETGFTSEERRFIETSGVINIGIDPEFKPYEFIDSDGMYKGIAADYVKLVNLKSGLNLQPVSGIAWDKAYEMAVEGSITVLPCVGITTERKKYFIFTEPYFSYQRVILSNSEINRRNYTVNDLEYLNVGVQRNTSHHSYIISETDIIPILFQTAEEGLLALSKGNIDVFVTNLASAGYMIKEKGITNIKVDNTITENTDELGFAINKNFPMLAEIIDKTLKMITEEEKIEIRNKWIGIQKEADYSGIIRITLIIGGILSAIIVYTFFWAYRLKKEINRRKKVELALLDAKKASDEANSAKSIFLARMSHEIRTPLNAITGMAYLMKKTTLSDIQEKYVKRLTDASHNLSEVINDILDFSKIESGEMRLEKIPFNLDRILDKVSNILNSKAVEKGLEFIIHKETRIPDNFLGDPTRISQVLINLINNAIKFTDRGEIFVNLQLLSEDTENVIVRFSIKDTGIGIPKNKMGNLFNPFDQLDSSTTRKYGGTGLGLAISKNIVTLMGGEIGVESIEGVGSDFYFTVPLSKDRNSTSEIEVQKTFPALDHIKTIVVDDNKISEQIIKEYLESFRIKSRSVRSGAEVLSAVGKEDFDLLIISHSLSDIDGFELCEHIHQMKLEKDPKIIFVTNSVREDIYNSAKSVGIDYIMLKPIIPSVLYDSIIQLFRKDLEIKPEEIGKIDKKRGEGYNVLLVEDYEVNQLISKEILEQNGFIVNISDNGREALDFMKNRGDEIDAILMDIHMPIMNGYESTREIRKIYGRTPIIAMTAVAISGVQKECLDAGMNDYITKPIDPENMFMVLEKHISAFRKERLEENADCEKDDTSPGGIRCPDMVIDTRQGILRAANNEKLYFEVLEKFYDDNIPTCKNADEMIKANDLDALKKLVHKIKGASGNLGGNRLYISSNTLLAALNSKIEKSIIPYFEEFENDMDSTLGEIKRILKIRRENGKNVEKSDGKFSGGKIDLDKLRKLLTGNDIDAFKILEDIKRSNPDVELESLADSIKSEMSNYRFKNALKILDEYISEHGAQN